jgi:hypothetical protein
VIKIVSIKIKICSKKKKKSNKMRDFFALCVGDYPKKEKKDAKISREKHG